MASVKGKYDLDKSGDLREVMLLLDSDVDELQQESEKESDDSFSDDSVEERGGDDQNDLEMSYVCHRRPGHQAPTTASTPHKYPPPSIYPPAPVSPIHLTDPSERQPGPSHQR